jgi:hypothetical protein
MAPLPRHGTNSSPLFRNISDPEDLENQRKAFAGQGPATSGIPCGSPAGAPPRAVLLLPLAHMLRGVQVSSNGELEGNPVQGIDSVRCGSAFSAQRKSERALIRSFHRIRACGSVLVNYP